MFYLFLLYKTSTISVFLNFRIVLERKNITVEVNIKPKRTPNAWNISTLLRENLFAKNPPRKNPKIAPKIGIIRETKPCIVWLFALALSFTISPFFISRFLGFTTEKGLPCFVHPDFWQFIQASEIKGTT